MAATGGNKDFQPSLMWRMGVSGAIALAVLVFDRVTKVAIQMQLDPAPFTGSIFDADFIPGVLRLHYIENIGASFSLGEGFGAAFILLALVVSAGSIVYLLRAPIVSKVETAGLALLVGGAIGNAIDRLLFGYVVDFLATEFIDFPVFNIADIGITCGVVLAFIGYALFSPANKLDATEELNRRDREDAARRARRRGEKARKIRENQGK